MARRARPETPRMNLEAFFRKHDFSADVDAGALLAEFDRQMDEGLAGRASSHSFIKMRTILIYFVFGQNETEVAQFDGKSGSYPL